MILTLRKPKLRTPPRHPGCVHPVEPVNRALRAEAPMANDPAALASSLREVSVTAHHALAAGADSATRSHLTARIEGIEQGFRDLGLEELARFAGSLKRKVEAGV